MKAPLLIAFIILGVLGASSALAMMNNACKSSHHAWCAPNSELRHAKIGRSQG